MTELAHWLVESDKATPIVEVLKMATARVTIPGIVKNSTAIPPNDTPLPEGAHVDIIFGPAPGTHE
jgi:hypothetical protein